MRNRESILGQKPRRYINADIDIYSSLPGVVPDYECMEACKFGGYSWSTWFELDNYFRASCVAHYRMHNLIEAHVTDSVRRAQDGAARSSRANRR